MNAASSCPPDYRYPPGALAAPPALAAETVYVVGGLYGNPEALEAVLAMKAREERTGPPVLLVFNGDFNWFDVDGEDFRALNEAVLEHTAMLGNVEAELAREGGGAGCGCNYPPYVHRDTVERSDRIFARLRETADTHPAIRRRLRALPMHLAVSVAGQKVVVLHGDPESLAGWSLAEEALRHAPHPESAAEQAQAPQTGPERIEGWFRASGAAAFAATHTCLPFARDFSVDGARRLVVNNGAAGMPNFSGLPGGLLTRVSSRPGVPPHSLYGCALDGVRYDALPIPYGQERWLKRFLRDWPEGSPAHQSYFERILHGPPYSLQRAARGRVALHGTRSTA